MPGPVRGRVWPVPLQLWEDAAGPRARLGIRCILDNTTELGGCGLNTHWHRDHFLQPFTKLVIYKYFMKYDQFTALTCQGRKHLHVPRGHCGASRDRMIRCWQDSHRG